jgi:CRISPR/Cas system-associated exonuclease Cas4 (RecB family)
MEYFLERIARSLYDQYGNTLNRHCLVFPNRRAGLFFLKYLADRIEKPVWSPSILTINELFRSYSTLQIAGNELLLFELYKIYRGIKKGAESFDDFYFWGDMLLNDFDDTDKYLVDASLLFRNVQDIKNIDQEFGGLTEYQIEIIKRFWINFNPDKPTNEKSGFISIWSVIYDIYSSFIITLKKQNLAYEGMIFREYAETPEKNSVSGTSWDIFHFIGFNALNECEKVIMTRFKKAGKARFYWDYDNSYIKEGKLNSAGLFIRDNLQKFGNDMPSDWSYDAMISSISGNVRRRVIETSSDIAQVKLISKLIEELPDLSEADAHHTAVVLADENLLMPVLTSLPENIGAINITMGYPFKQTLVYTLVKHLMDLQRTASDSDGVVKFSHNEVFRILKHALIEDLLSKSDNKIIEEITKANLIRVPVDRFSKSEYLQRIFKKPSTPGLLSGYFKEILTLLATNNENKQESQENSTVQQNVRNEFIYRTVLNVNRLETVINSSEVNITADTYLRILDRMLRMQSVPFSGEPLSGIQVMGILETRVLDFKNVIILSVNEGVLPAVSSGSSYIPFSLREAFGLPSVNHQESIYAYHFYRLLQRAENVTFTFNSNSEGLRSGEISRFLIQMKYETAMKPDFIDMNFEIKTQGSIREYLERTREHSFELQSRFLDRSKGSVLSPSAINTWLNCRMKFYYRYVNRLKEPEKISSDIDPAVLGNIFHEIMKSVYKDYLGQIVTGEMLNSIIRNDQLLTGLTDDAVNIKFRESSNGMINGNELIVREVLMAYLRRVLNTDKLLVPLEILNLEDYFSFILSVLSNGSQIEIVTGGLVDRIDIVNGVTRIVDYKTGIISETIKSLDELFEDDRKKDADAWLQTLLYSEAYLVNNPGCIVQPAVYKIKKMTGGGHNEKLRLITGGKNEMFLDDYKLVREEFIYGLKGVVSKIFSDDEPFTMTRDLRGKCLYCPYKELCMR